MAWKIKDPFADVALPKLPKGIKVGAIDMVWQTKEGQQIKIADMRDSHLLNCIRLLQRRGAEAKIVLASKMSVEKITVTMFPIYVAMVKEMTIRLKGIRKQPVQLVLTERPKRKFQT